MHHLACKHWQVQQKEWILIFCWLQGAASGLQQNSPKKGLTSQGLTWLMSHRVPWAPDSVSLRMKETIEELLLGKNSDFARSCRAVSPGSNFEMEPEEASAIVSGAIESNLSERSWIENHSSFVWLWLSSCSVCFSSHLAVSVSDDNDIEVLTDLNEDCELLFRQGPLCFVPIQMIFIKFKSIGTFSFWSVFFFCSSGFFFFSICLFF